jgi:hypothetical protein
MDYQKKADKMRRFSPLPQAIAEAARRLERSIGQSIPNLKIR